MLRISDEVRAALAAGEPVVALESTVLAHGLPRPRNLEVGRALEDEIRSGGAVPATVAVLAGVPCVGLSAAEIEHVASADGVLKLSTRDLPVAVARGRDGATTVASTAWLAHRAGVRVFATGGIGGVHRGEPRDVSADLTELGRTPLVVVCAGAKSILDLPATREALETAGVLVLGWRTGEIPAFYARESGLEVDLRVEEAEEVAALWKARSRLGTPGALLLCVPPPEEAALPADAVRAAIEGALEEAEERGVRGKEVTPFLLGAVARLTGGRSLEANVALLRSNARVAARVAAALAGR
jgi:pseudouridine-5'-phosphate glycosidase